MGWRGSIGLSGRKWVCKRPRRYDPLRRLTKQCPQRASQMKMYLMCLPLTAGLHFMNRFSEILHSRVRWSWLACQVREKTDTWTIALSQSHNRTQQNVKSDEDVPEPFHLLLAWDISQLLLTSLRAKGLRSTRHMRTYLRALS